MLILSPSNQPCMWDKWILVFFQQRCRCWPLADKLPSTGIVRRSKMKEVEHWCIRCANLLAKIATYISHSISMFTSISNSQTINQYIVNNIWLKLEKKNQHITSLLNKSPDLYNFIGEFYKTFKELITNLQNLLQKIKEKEIPSNAFYEVIIMYYQNQRVQKEKTSHEYLSETQI